MKIVINSDWGGFSLSNTAIQRYAELTGMNLISQPDERYSWTNWYRDVVDDEHYWSELEIARNDQHLVQVVEELGDAANGEHASLKVVSVPDDVEWDIEEYDGREHVAERHRTWS